MSFVSRQIGDHGLGTLAHWSKLPTRPTISGKDFYMDYGRSPLVCWPSRDHLRGNSTARPTSVRHCGLHVPPGLCRGFSRSSLRPTLRMLHLKSWRPFLPSHNNTRRKSPIRCQWATYDLAFAITYGGNSIFGWPLRTLNYVIKILMGTPFKSRMTPRLLSC